jgi:hypothetical protein
MLVVDEERGRGVEEKPSTLQTYRHREEWSRDHHCPGSIQLHVLQEVWDTYHSEDEEVPNFEAVGDCSPQFFVVVSVATLSRQSIGRSIQLQDAI